jgi:cob(I)alamin adenosyltransferase
VAVVSHVSTPQQRTLITTLNDAPDQVEQHGITSPAVILVGEVVTLHERLDWFQRSLTPETAPAKTQPKTAATTPQDDTARTNILIFTGNGKGKSTAAFGMALRAVGHGQRVLILQFMKNDADVGELAGLKRLGIRVEQCGLGFVPRPDHPLYAAHRKAAEQGLARAEAAIFSGEHDLIILDEMCGAVARGLLEEERVADLLRRAPAGLNLVLTGRNAPEALLEIADTVSEIQPLKHAFDQGVHARRGVEF